MSRAGIAERRSRGPALDAVAAAPGNHRVLFENASPRVMDVTLADGGEEPIHHHRWPSISIFDQVQGHLRPGAGAGP